jgi:hypothetical protein
MSVLSIYMNMPRSLRPCTYVGYPTSAVVSLSDVGPPQRARRSLCDVSFLGEAQDHRLCFEKHDHTGKLVGYTKADSIYAYCDIDST